MPPIVAGPQLQHQVERGLDRHLPHLREPGGERDAAQAGPASVPIAVPSWDSAVGVQNSVDAAWNSRPAGWKLSSSRSVASGSTSSTAPPGARTSRTRASAPTGSPRSCSESTNTARA